MNISDIVGFTGIGLLLMSIPLGVIASGVDYISGLSITLAAYGIIAIIIAGVLP